MIGSVPVDGHTIDPFGVCLDQVPRWSKPQRMGRLESCSLCGTYLHWVLLLCLKDVSRGQHGVTLLGRWFFTHPNLVRPWPVARQQARRRVDLRRTDNAKTDAHEDRLFLTHHRC